MQSIEAYEKYVEEIKKDMLNVMKSRILFLEIKTRLLKKMNSKEDFTEFKMILQKEVNLVSHLKKRKKHIFRNIKNLDKIKGSLKEKKVLRKKLKQASIIYTWLFSQTYLIEHQKKALRKRFEFFRKRRSKLMMKIDRIFKKDLEAYVLKEEQQLMYSMKVFEHRSHGCFEYSHEIRKLEKLEHLEFIFLRTAMFFNALPFHGIGDFLSLPFWFLDGLIRSYERTFKDYSEWRNIKKTNLKDLREEIENLQLIY